MFQSDSHQGNAFQDGPGPLVQSLGWEIPSFQPPSMSTVVRRRYAAIKGRSGFAFFNFVPYGWEVPPFQPPHPQPERRYAGIVQKDDGTQFPFIRFIPNDWDTHPFQPPHPRPEQRYAAIAQKDEGIQAQFIRFFPYGWEIAPIQPRHPRPEAAGAFMPSEAGIEAQYVPTSPVAWGWPISPPDLVFKRYYAGLKGSSQFPIFS